MKKMLRLPVICLIAALFIGSSVSAQDLEFVIDQPNVDTLCPGDPVMFGATIVSAHTGQDITNLMWDMGGTGNYFDINPEHTFAEEGTYEVSLTMIADSGNQYTDLRIYHVVDICGQGGGDAIYPQMEGPSQLCAGDVATYNSQAWTEGNAQIHTSVLFVRNDMGEEIANAPGQMIDFQFEEPGMYYVELQIQDTTLGLFQNNSIEVMVDDCQGGGGVDVMIDVQCETEEGMCDGSVTANVTPAGDYSFTWGGGETSPTLTSLCPGMYMVSVVDNADTTNKVHTQQVELMTCGTQEFNVYIDHMDGYCEGDNFQFYANVEGGTPPYSFEWSVSGQAAGADQGLSYDFPLGSYNLEVVVMDNSGADRQASINLEVTDCNGGGGGTDPVDFYIWTDNGEMACPFQPVAFHVDLYNYSEEAIKSVMWDFGNGNTSTDLHAVTQFEADGQYQVQLTLEADSGTASTRDYMIQVMGDQCPQLGEFTWNGQLCMNDTNAFVAAGNPNDIQSYAWDFGNDGTVDITEGPTVYWAFETADDNEVVLTVIGTDGSTYSSGVQHLYVDSCNPPNPAEFHPNSYCIEQPVSFYMYNINDYDYDSVNWQVDGMYAGAGTDFSYQFPSEGEYNVRAEAFLKDGSSPHYNYQVNIGQCPPIYVDDNACVGQETWISWQPMLQEHQQFEAQSFAWMIDGTALTESNEGVYYTFQDTGLHTISLDVTYEMWDDSLQQQVSGTETFTRELHITDCNNNEPAYINYWGECTEQPYHFELHGGYSGEVSWDYGEGNGVQGFGQSVDHQYAGSGEFQVIAFVDGNEVANIYVQVNDDCNGGNGDIWHHSEPVCTEEPTQFYFSDPDVMSVEWNFAGMGGASGMEVEFQFTEEGDYEITVTYQREGEEPMTETRMLYVYSDCNQSGGGGQDLFYSGTCAGEPVEWYLNPDLGVDPNDYTWVFDFGNGVSSTEYPATVTYDEPGVYMAMAVVTENATGDQDTLMQEAHIHDCTNQGGGGDGDFYWDNHCAGEPLSVQMNNQEEDPMTLSWSWTIMETNETYTGYPLDLNLGEGSYHVSATATGGANGDKTYEFTIDIYDCNGEGGGAPGLLFSTTCIGEPTVASLDFGESDDFDPTKFTWTWTIAGEVVSDSYPGEFTWNEAGAFEAKVQADAIDVADTSDSGFLDFTYFAEDCQNSTGPDIFHVFVENPCTESPSTVIVQGPIANLAGVSIDFGDGSAAVEGTSAEHQFAAGSYAVAATLSTAKGDTTIEQMVEIHSCFVEVPDTISLDFVSQGNCAKEDVVFEAQSNAADAVAYVNWDFGDGKVGSGMQAIHRYASAGTYEVTATFADFNGQEGTEVMSVTIDPCFEVGVVNFNVGGELCVNKEVQFGDLTTYPNVVERVWNFGGGKTSFQANPVHKFTTPGSREVSLTITTAKGLVADTSFLVTIDACFVGEADFEWMGTCAGDTTFFTNASTVIPDSTTSIAWTIDGNAVAGDNPKMVFEQPGSYPVALTVNHKGETLTSQYNVHVIDCDTGEVFVDLVGKHVTCYTYGDGKIEAYAAGVEPLTYAWSNGANTAKISNLGAATYTVTVTAGNGKTATASFQVLTKAAVQPEISASAMEVCDGEMITLEAPAGFSGYDWSTGDASQSVTVDETGTYSVQVVDQDGCSGSGQISVTVHDIQQVIVTAQPAVCEGDVSVMTASGVKSVVWGKGLGILKTVSTTPSKTTTYSVMGKDENGCKSTASVTVGVFAVPTVDFTVDDADCGKSSGVVTANVTGGAAPYMYAWEGGETTQMIDSLPSGAFAVMVTDSNGCVATGVAPVADLEGPTVAINAGLGSNCGGPDGSASANVSGGQPPYSYSWTNSAGAVVSSDSEIENVAAGVYGLKVTDVAGCKGVASTKIVKVGDNPPSIIGHVESSANGWNIQGGQLKVVRDHKAKGKFNLIAEAEIDSVGNFNIPSILPIGDYYVVALPDTSIAGQEFQIPSYFKISGDTVSTTHKWVDATPYGAACDSMLEVDIKIIDLQPLDGTSNLSGGLFEEDTVIAGKSSGILGDPIPGISVSLEQVPGGIVAQTTTDEDGFYQFDNVPEGDYTIHVDIPGLEMEQTYDLELETSDTTVVELDFVITEEVITIEVEDTKVEEFNTSSAFVRMYPNPFRSTAYVAYTLHDAQDVTVDVYNMLGERVIHTQSFDKQPGTHKLTLDAAEFGSETGIYVVRMTIGNEVISARMISVE